jgi:hypothetical protein
VIVPKSDDRLVQIPENGNSRQILEPPVVDHVAQLRFGNRVLLDGKPVMDVDPEISDENVKRELRPRRKKNSGRVIVRVIQVERVPDADIEPERVKLSDRPECVEIDLRAQNDVAL